MISRKKPPLALKIVERSLVFHFLTRLRLMVAVPPLAIPPARAHRRALTAAAVRGA
jgi:hypothetical protein